MPDIRDLEQGSYFEFTYRDTYPCEEHTDRYQQMLEYTLYPLEECGFVNTDFNDFYVEQNGVARLEVSQLWRKEYG